MYKGDQSYYEKLKEIEHFKLHPEYIPYVGENYSKYRILFVGESHYITKCENPKYFEKWYEVSTEEILKGIPDNNPNESSNREHLNCIDKGWFDTRGVVGDFLDREEKIKPHVIFRKASEAISKVLQGDKGGMSHSSTFGYVAFCNYFQRPSLVRGKTIDLSDIDKSKSKEIFDKMVEIIEPNFIGFLSKKAYWAYNANANDNNKTEIHSYCHPGCSWWYKKSYQKTLEDHLKIYLLKK